MDQLSPVARVRAAILAARSTLNAEIRTYPTPISGCDAQFNHLLSERGRITAALHALEEPVFVPTPRMPTSQSDIESR